MYTDMIGLEQRDDNVIDAEHWREVDSDYRADMKEGLHFDDIIAALKRRIKGLKVNGVTVWRSINWFIVWRICCTFITFLLDETFFDTIPYVAPGIPWSGVLKMIGFFIALNVALNASEETNKDDFRFATAVALSAIPTIFMIFAGRMGLFNLFIAGCLSFSVYREKIYTDANVRRTPPKKERTEITRDEKGNPKTIDKYNV